MSLYLITGGAGFIGSHLVDALLARGDRVRVLDNFSTGKRENLAQSMGQIELIEGDIRDIETVTRAIEGVDYVSHQAALRSVPKSMTRPREFNDVNVGGTLNLLVAAKACGVKKFVLASSSTVYGNDCAFPQTEGAESFPISPYALSKKMAEDYGRLFSEVYGLSTIALRYFNVYGPRQDLENEYAVVVPKFIVSLLKGEGPPIYGDGSQSRDFTYISDTVRANLLALQSGSTCVGTFNAGGGVTHSVLELAEILSQLMDVSIAPHFLPPRAGDAHKTHANPRKIAEVLNWKTHVGFEEGLRKTVEWFKEGFCGA